MVRETHPAMGFNVRIDDGWSRIEHKIHPSKGWFCWKDAPFYIEYDRGLGNNPRVKYEKWVFTSFSFIEDVIGDLPSISVDESQIISKNEISEEEYMEKSGN